MKKLFPLMVVAVVATMFTSCKKDYTCTCTITTAGSTTTQPFAYPKMTKSDATDACKLQESTWTTGASTAKCSL